MAEEQVIDDYYVSLQKGEIDSRARIGDLSKEELIDKLKENLNADLDQIAAQINSSGKDKWRNSTVKSTAQQNKHIRFSSPSDDEEKENKEEKFEKKQSPRKSNEKSPSPSKRNGGKKPFNNRKQSPTKPKKVIDYNQFEALNGAPRVNEIIAFQILEISSNFTPEVSDYKVGTVIDFDSKTNETTLQLHSEYNSILKRSNKFSIVFEETEDDEQLNYEDSPRSNKSNKEEEIIKVDWRNLMNIKLIPEGFDLKQLQDEDEVEEESEQKTNGHKSEDESEEQVIDDYYETVKKVDRYNKSNTNKKTNCCRKQQQPQKQEAKPDQKTVKKQQEEKAKNEDLDRIASSVKSHAKAKWKNSAPSKAANSNAPKHIRFPSGSSSSSSCSSSSSSSSDSSSSNDDEEMRSENKSKVKSNKNNQDRKDKVVPSKKSEQVVNKVKQLLTTASPETKPNSSQVSKTKSPKTQSLKPIDSKNKTKEEEKEKEKPTVAIDTQTFMIQIGNVFELNSNSKEVTVKFNSNYKSEINLKITNKDQSDDVSEKKKKKKKEEKSPKVELDWKNSMNVKLIPNEISLNMKSQKEGEEEKEEDDDVKMRESDSSSNESESESESEEEEIVASKKSSNQKTANQNGSKRKINEPGNRQQKQTSQKVNEEKVNSKTTKTDSSSSKKATSTHIRFDSSSSDSSSSSSSASSDSSTSSDSEDEPIERKPQSNLKSKQYANQQQYNKPVAKKNQQQDSAAAKTSPQKQAKNTQQQEQQRNKYYQPSKEEQVNAISYNRAFLLQNPKDMSDFKKVFNQTKLNAPNPEEFLLKYDQADQHPPELIIDEEEVLAQQQQQLIESATSQYQEPSSYQDQDQQTTDDQLQFLQEQQNAFVAPPKIDFTKFEPLSGVPNAEDKIAFQLLEISPNYTPEVSSYKVATVLGFDHDSGEITLKLDDNLIDKPSTSLVEGLDLLANGEFRPQQPKDDVLRMDWRNLMNIRLLPKAHL